MHMTQPKEKYAKRKKRMKFSSCCFILNGVLALILGVNLFIFHLNIMSYIAELLLNLNSDSYVYSVWQKYPMDMPIKFRFFNWTNHKDFFNKSVKPKFKEIGPYSYLQNIERVDVVKNENNNTITFKQLRTFRYDNNYPNNGNVTDQLITINYISMAINHITQDWNSLTKEVLSEYFSLFDPHYYFNTIIDYELLKGNDNLLLELSNYFDFIAPEFPRFDGFGWLKMRHGQPNFDGVFNMANGANRQFDILNWNYYDITPYFNNSCAKIKGSLGDIQSYPLNKQFISVFAPELCRYITLYFEDEMIVDGILGYKYSFTKMSLDNGTVNPENKCFCNKICMPSGLLSAFCRFNNNFFMSLPHFYNADPTYLDSFEGLNPEKHKHESYIVVEPKSLLCLKFKISVQINALVYPVEGSVFDDIPKRYFPLHWLEVQGQLPDEVKSYLHSYLNFSPIITYSAITLIILGACLTLYAAYKFRDFYWPMNSKIIDQDLVKQSEQVPLKQP